MSNYLKDDGPILCKVNFSYSWVKHEFKFEYNRVIKGYEK